MQKKLQKTIALIARRETIRQLDSSRLPEVAGGVRMWRPVGFADDSTPVYGWVDDTLGGSG